MRLLSADDPEKQERTLDLFERAQSGEIDLLTSEAIVAETVFVLTSARLYAASRETVAQSLLALLSIQSVHMDNKEVILAALQRFGASRFAFADCLCIEHARRRTAGMVFTYDRGFDRVPDIRRLEP